MGELAEALKQKYKTPHAALKALGLDEALLRKEVVGDAMPNALKGPLGRLKQMASDMKRARDQRPGDPPMTDIIDHSLDEEPHAALRTFLKSKGLSDDEIEEACKRASVMAGDDPPDLAFGGEPRPGGGMTRFRPDGSGNSATELKRGTMDARALAMEAVMRVGMDGAAPVPHPGPMPDTSSRSMASFAARFPEAARIKIM